MSKNKFNTVIAQFDTKLTGTYGSYDSVRAAFEVLGTFLNNKRGTRYQPVYADQVDLSNRRQVGPAMRSLANKGFIAATGETFPCRIPSAKGRKVNQWVLNDSRAARREYQTLGQVMTAL